MRATELLTRDHEEMKQLFRDFETARGDDRRRLVDRTATELLIHSEVEKDLFYPALAAFEETAPLVQESLQDHRMVDALIEQMQSMDVDDPTFAERFTQLRTDVIHHVTEEEQQLFPKAIRLLGDSKLELMGDQIIRQKSELRTHPDARTRRRA